MPLVDVRLLAFCMALSICICAQAEAINNLASDLDPCFRIQNIEIDAGSDRLPSDLQHLLKNNSALPPTSACFSANHVQALIDRLQNTLINQGYVTSRVLATPQNLQTGTLKLSILLGKVQHITWTINADGKPRRANSWNTLPISTGDVLNLRDIEQGLENFKRVPTVEADIEVLPAEEPGYSNLQIKHRQNFPFRLSLTIDDSGTQSTGKQQASTTLSYDNWLTLSDLFYVSVNHDTGQGKDPGARGIHGKTLHYSMPFGYQLLSFNHSQSNYHQTVSGFSQDYVYAGNSETTDIKLSRVVHRNATGKTTASVKAFHRQSSNFIDDTEIEVQKRIVGGWILELAHKQTWQSVSAEGSLAYKKGTSDFGAIPAPEEAFNEGTSRMRIWTAEANLNWPFKLAEQTFNYNLSWRQQQQDTKLTPQDYFSIGGRYTVRGFDGINTLGGDKGWLWRNELSVNAGSEHKLYWGLDTGHVAGPAAENLAGRNLTGTVIGLRAQHGHFQYDIFVGGPLKAPDRFKTAHRTAGFSIAFNI